MKSSKSLVVLTQIADFVSKPLNPRKEYYKAVYDKIPGYRGTVNDAYLEIPTWMAVLTGVLSPHHRVIKHIVEDMEFTKVTFQNNYLLQDAVFLFSALEENKEAIKYLASELSQQVYIGGYVNPEYFADLPNVTWCNSVGEISLYLEASLNSPPSYDLFFLERTIPRITLSTGCYHECTFCTIPRSVISLTWPEIKQQAESFWPLDFNLVYVDDKTFGQADNWKMLKPLGIKLANINPEFQGFIVQTTVPYALKYYNTWADEYFVKAVEVGVEIPDDKYLAQFKKPYRMKQLDQLMDVVSSRGWDKDDDVAFIPNIIFGSPGDDHVATLNWLVDNRCDIAFINPAVLSLYEDMKGDTVPGTPVHASGNAKENAFGRSWLSPKEQREMEWAINYAMEMFGGQYV